MAIQAVDWFVPEHHLSMYWFKVSFLRGGSRRAGKIDDAISKRGKRETFEKLGIHLISKKTQLS